MALDLAPMSRAAFVLGHVIAEFAASLVALTVLMLSGLIVGWRIESDLLHALAGFALLMGFALA